MRKGMMVGKGKKGYHNIIPKDPRVHSMSAKGMKQPQRIPHIPIIHSKKPQLSMFEKGEIIGDIYSDEITRSQTYLLSDSDSGITGHKKELPYYIEEGNINFDTNANYEQTGMNNAMANLLKEAGLELNDLKEEMEYSWNGDSDSYLSFVSGETEMPKNNLPISHGGDTGDGELQIESVEKEYDRNKQVYEKKGITLNDFRKILQDDFFLKNDLIFSPYNYSSVISIPKDKFINKIKEKGKSLNKEDLKIIESYKN